MTAPAKVTYVSLSADNPEVRAGFDAAIAQIAGELGATHPMRIAGAARQASATTDSLSPADTRVVVARVPSGTAADVNDAVAAARAAFPTWSRTPWAERARLIERAADIIRERVYELSVWLIWEMGKNRVEALGEIFETADLLTYYAKQMREHRGFVREMDKLAPTDRNV